MGCADSPRRAAGVLLLALAVLLLALGLWRGYVRLYGGPDDYLLTAAFGWPTSPSFPDRKKAEVEERFTASAQKLEGVLATSCLIGAGAAFWGGWRQLHPPRPPGPPA